LISQSRGLGDVYKRQLLGDGLVDELLVYLAPVLIGNGMGIANLGPFESLSQALKLDIQNVTPIGDDIRLIAHINKGQ
jgi:diaminohydroxyphosphoribosylaminopyrimidine deaminase/5-amino-6-(5-phosphoribosylamino)uracil reductase